MKKSVAKSRIDKLVHKVHHAKTPFNRLKALNSLFRCGMTEEDMQAVQIMPKAKCTDVKVIHAFLDAQIIYDFDLRVWMYEGVDISQDQVDFWYRVRTTPRKYTKPVTSSVINLSPYYRLVKTKSGYDIMYYTLTADGVKGTETITLNATSITPAIQEADAWIKFNRDRHIHCSRSPL